MKKKIQISKEISGAMLSECLKLGHEAYGNDILPAEHNLPFLQGDTRDFLNMGFDVLIGFPPCTFLCKTQIHLVQKSEERRIKSEAGAAFFLDLYNSPIESVALEYPPGLLNSWFKQPTQIINPFQFGDPYRKEIGLWLKNMPPVLFTYCTGHRMKMQNHTNGRMTNSERSKIRSSWSRFPKMAESLAFQWLGKA